MFLYIRQAWLVLLLSLCFGVALAGVNTALSERIAENARLARERAAVEVFTPKGADPAAKKAFIAEATAEEMAVELDGVAKTVYRVTGPKDKLLGWAVPAKGQGYADTIKLVFGVEPDASKLTGVKVIYNQETPGLGNKIVDMQFRDRFVGKPTAAALVAAKKTSGFKPNEIQAITGATISSQAICDIISNQLEQGELTKKLAAQAK